MPQTYAAMKVLIRAGNLDRLIPNGGLQAEDGPPMELTKVDARQR